MRALAISVALVVFGFSSADVYHVQHRRPSVLLGNILGGSSPSVRIYEIKGGSATFVPEGLNLKADDRASTIDIEGTPTQVADMVKVLDQFDVAPLKLSARITIHSKADKYDSTTDTQINNNSIFSLQDQTTGLSLQVSPRINGDGSITGTFTITTSAGSIKVVSRLARDNKLTFGGSADQAKLNALEAQAAADHRLIDVLDGMDIDIAFTVNQETKTAAAAK